MTWWSVDYTACSAIPLLSLYSLALCVLYGCMKFGTANVSDCRYVLYVLYGLWLSNGLTAVLGTTRCLHPGVSGLNLLLGSFMVSMTFEVTGTLATFNSISTYMVLGLMRTVVVTTVKSLQHTCGLCSTGFPLDIPVDHCMVVCVILCVLYFGYGVVTTSY